MRTAGTQVRVGHLIRKVSKLSSWVYGSEKIYRVSWSGSGVDVLGSHGASACACYVCTATWIVKRVLIRAHGHLSKYRCRGCVRPSPQAIAG